MNKIVSQALYNVLFEASGALSHLLSPPEYPTPISCLLTSSCSGVGSVWEPQQKPGPLGCLHPELAETGPFGPQTAPWPNRPWFLLLEEFQLCSLFPKKRHRLQKQTQLTLGLMCCKRRYLGFRPSSVTAWLPGCVTWGKFLNL